jgi:hypothetical protein
MSGFGQSHTTNSGEECVEVMEVCGVVAICNVLEKGGEGGKKGVGVHASGSFGGSLKEVLEVTVFPAMMVVARSFGG